VNFSTGQFRVVDVPRGSYTLRAVQYQADPEKWFAAETPLTVASEPIRNLVIELTSGADVPVSVSYEAGAQAAGRLYLMLQPEHTRSNLRDLSIGGPELPQESQGAEQEPRSEAAQAKVLTNVVPDTYKLSVEPGGNGSDYVAAATLGERDVLHAEFSIGGSTPGELHVTIRGDSASVEGQVSLKGQPAPQAQVYLIAGGGGAGGLRTAVCDAEGHYEIRGVPPGDYRIQAWKPSPTPAEVLARSGEAVPLQPGEQRSVALEAASGNGGSEQDQ
jgi:hypothetical protein